MNLSLEKLRTKEELIKYFKTLGKNITEEKINALKQSYEQIEENNGNLSLEQLDSVAGGLHLCILFDKESGTYSMEFHGDVPYMPKRYEKYIVPIQEDILEKSHLDLLSLEPSPFTTENPSFNATYLPINFGTKVFYFCISVDEIKSQISKLTPDKEDLEIRVNSYLEKLSKYIYAEKFLEKYSVISHESEHPFYDLLQKFNLEAILNFSNGSSELQDS